MKITKLGAVTLTLLGSAPIGLSGQISGPKNPTKTGTVRSDVRELPADQQVIQALNRLTFGPRPGDALKVRAMGLDNWIDLQLHPEKIDDSTIEKFVGRYTAINRNQNDLLVQYAQQQRERREVKRERA